jgi:hypothetical protein
MVNKDMLHKYRMFQIGERKLFVQLALQMWTQEISKHPLKKKKKKKRIEPTNSLKNTFKSILIITNGDKI